MRQTSILLLVAACALAATADPFCPVEDTFVDSKLKDPVYTDSVIACVLGDGQCTDKLMTRARRLAPEILKGRCPRPCSACVKKQMQKAIGFMWKKRPQQMQRMLSKARAPRPVVSAQRHSRTVVLPKGPIEQ